MALFGGLWRDRDFVKFWTGETISQFGSQVTVLALPLTAILTLNATSTEVGVLNAASYLPFLVLTLFIGVSADRMRRRPIMAVSALCRSLVLAAIPILAMQHVLQIEFLYIAALLLGVFTVLFDVTYQAYLPSLVDRSELIEGNAKLQGSASAAQVGGPALGGWLVTWLTAPIALAVDAVSFLLSAASIAAIRRKEPRPERPAEKQHILRDISDGLKFTFGNRSLRACVLEAGTYNMFWLVFETVFLLYATRELHISPAAIGVTLGCGAVGALVGAVLAKRLSTRFGVGTTVTAAMITGCAAPVLVPIAMGPSPIMLTMLVLAFFIGGMGTTVANIQVVSLRQTITPDPMLGRMNASYRFVAWGTVPIGALVGGVLGDAIGLRPTLFVAAAGLFAAALWIVFSPIRRIADLSKVDDSETQAAVPKSSVADQPL